MSDERSGSGKDHLNFRINTFYERLFFFWIHKLLLYFFYSDSIRSDSTIASSSLASDSVTSVLSSCSSSSSSSSSSSENDEADGEDSYDDIGDDDVTIGEENTNAYGQVEFIGSERRTRARVSLK